MIEPFLLPSVEAFEAVDDFERAVAVGHDPDRKLCERLLSLGMLFAGAK
jgi:hypothetical protein